MTPQETEPDLPVSVQESPVEAGVDSGRLQGQGHGMQQSWEPRHAAIVLLKKVTTAITPP